MRRCSRSREDELRRLAATRSLSATPATSGARTKFETHPRRRCSSCPTCDSSSPAAARSSSRGAGARAGRTRSSAPYVPREQLSESLSAVDAHLVSLQPALEGLIVPSKFYGILAVGRPVIFIGARDGELARIIEEHRCGVVVEPGDVEGLANAIRELANDPARAAEMGRRGRELYETHFAPQVALRGVGTSPGGGSAMSGRAWRHGCRASPRRCSPRCCAVRRSRRTRGAIRDRRPIRASAPSGSRCIPPTGETAASLSDQVAATSIPRRLEALARRARCTRHCSRRGSRTALRVRARRALSLVRAERGATGRTCSTRPSRCCTIRARLRHAARAALAAHPRLRRTSAAARREPATTRRNCATSPCANGLFAEYRELRDATRATARSPTSIAIEPTAYAGGALPPPAARARRGRQAARAGPPRSTRTHVRCRRAAGRASSPWS